MAKPRHRPKSSPDTRAAPPRPAPDRLLTEQEAAARLGWSEKSLQRRRWLGLPPGWFKIGSSVRYSEREIEEFIRAGRREPTEVDEGSAHAPAR